MKVIPPNGSVDLREKMKPICHRSEPFDDFYAFTLATIDIKGWKAKLNSLPESIWKDDQQEGNVRLVRAAHDVWGIEKIIFTFCDDFLQQVLDLPFSEDEEWKVLFDEVYKAVGIERNQVVRSLLARMPAGVTIPPHHDTGAWVKHTHRCHLALQTDDLVEFWVGPVDDKMVPYLFDEGRIVELNNQAKHAVYNKMPSGYRTHLIFDYVDIDYSPVIPRVSLNPGEIVFQTRRSIDLQRNILTYNLHEHLPRFLIIGAQKSGTTSLYELICQHPLVMKPKRRETHYLDWRWNQAIAEDDIDGHCKFYSNFYETPALQRHPSLVSGESTPSYMLHYDIVIPRMKLLFPWTKLLIMLRNPVDRLYSQYQMIIDPSGTPEQLKNRGQSAFKNMSFEEIIQQEITELQVAGINAETTTSQEFAERVLRHRRDLKHGGHSLVIRGLYCFQIEAFYAAWPSEQLKIMSVKDLKQGEGQGEGLVEKMNEIYAYLNLPAIDEVLDDEVKNSRVYEPIGEEVRGMLEEFYRPYNERLFRLLGQDLVW